MLLLIVFPVVMLLINARLFWRSSKGLSYPTSDGNAETTRTRNQTGPAGAAPIAAQNQQGLFAGANNPPNPVPIRGDSESGCGCAIVLCGYNITNCANGCGSTTCAFCGEGIAGKLRWLILFFWVLQLNRWFSYGAPSRLEWEGLEGPYAVEAWKGIQFDNCFEESVSLAENGYLSKYTSMHSVVVEMRALQFDMWWLVFTYSLCIGLETVVEQLVRRRLRMLPRFLDQR